MALLPLSTIETYVQAGRLTEAAEHLRALPPKTLSPTDALQAALLARRVGLTGWGLRLLAPLTRQEENAPASLFRARLFAEYAVLLQRKGVLSVAERILRSVSPDILPEVLLYRAFGLFSEWSYAESIPLLREYCARTEDPYKRLIGEVNLSAALVNTEQDLEARSELKSLTARLRERGAHRLLANSLELQAEVELRTGNDTAAEGALSEAHDILGVTTLHDELFIQQWRAFLIARRSHDIEPLLRYRENALLRRDFESVREADRLRLLIRFDNDLYAKLFIGTPYPAYRARLERYFPQAIRPSNHHSEGLDPGLSVAEGRLKNHSLKGQNLRILRVLLRDIYRPPILGSLFSQLHPDEFYDPSSSPGRVQQALHRFREATRIWPMQLTRDRNLYVLNTPHAVVRSLQFEADATSNLDLLRSFLAQWPRRQDFERQDLEERLKVGKTRAQLILKEGLAAQLISRTHAGKATRYEAKS